MPRLVPQAPCAAARSGKIFAHRRGSASPSAPRFPAAPGPRLRDAVVHSPALGPRAVHRFRYGSTSSAGGDAAVSVRFFCNKRRCASTGSSLARRCCSFRVVEVRVCSENDETRPRCRREEANKNHNDPKSPTTLSGRELNAGWRRPSGPPTSNLPRPRPSHTLRATLGPLIRPSEARPRDALIIIRSRRAARLLSLPSPRLLVTPLLTRSVCPCPRRPRRPCLAAGVSATSVAAVWLSTSVCPSSGAVAPPNRRRPPPSDTRARARAAKNPSFRLPADHVAGPVP